MSGKSKRIVVVGVIIDIQTRGTLELTITMKYNRL